MGAKKRRTFRKSNSLRLGTAVLVCLLAVMILAQRAAAKTYVITDGDRTLTYTTSAADPAAVLGQAGLSLGAEDSYTTENVDGSSVISVHRANVTINYHGTARKVVSHEETAGELLHRLGLTVTGEDLVSHGMDDRTYEGMVLTVGVPVTVQETYSSTLPHSVTYCNAASIPEGMEAVLVEGVNGELRCTADVTYLGSQEVSRENVRQTLVRPAVTEIVAVGTGQPKTEKNDPIISDGYITLPTGEVLTYYKTDTIRATAYTHTDEGCDMVTATGTSVHWGTVAVDPRYIPYGTRMFIMASDGSYVYGLAVAEDCGGDIKRDRMDLYMPTIEQCMEFGRRRCTIYFLG